MNAQRYILCRPEGGLNDMLNQIEKCCRYAERFDRRVIVETDFVNASAFRDDITRYFVSLDPRLILKAGDLSAYGDMTDILPRVVSGQVDQYAVRYVRAERAFVEKPSGVHLTFDFETDHDQRVLLHHAAGGGRRATDALRRVRLHPDLRDVLIDRHGWIGRAYCGVHIRNTDIGADYLDEIAGLARRVEGPIFVATDNRASLEDCRAAFGAERVFSFAQLPETPGVALHRPASGVDTYSANVDAITDLLLLALSTECFTFNAKPGIHGKIKSGFSRLALSLRQDQPLLANLIGPGATDNVGLPGGTLSHATLSIEPAPGAPEASIPFPASEPSPVELHRRAAALFADDATLSEGLRLTAKAALRQGAAALALDATGALVARPDRSDDAIALRVMALNAAGRFDEALALTADAPASGQIHFEAAVAHILLGAPRDARRSARAAIALSDLDEPRLRLGRWLASYAAALIGEPSRPNLVDRWRGPPPDEPATPIIALLDYKTPDLARGSVNIGDWMQSLAALRQLARLEGVAWSHDDPDLAPLMQALSETWTAAERIACSGRAHLAVIDRDYPAAAAIRFPGRRVWVIANGWYAAPVFGDTRAWPAPEGFEPLLLAVHMARSGDLTPARMAWMRRHGPVGCRDPATAAWLRSQKVETFFSGCLTMTLGVGASSTPSSPRFAGDFSQREKMGERLAVDAAPDGSDWTTLSHQDPELRGETFAAAMTRAWTLLRRYAAADLIQTSRLHCALPARAVGASVEFTPTTDNDRRFRGLADLSPEDFDSVAGRLNDLMAAVLPMIVEGREPAAVRERIAERSIGRRRPVRPLADRAWGPARKAAPREVTVALTLDAAYVSQARTLLASIRRNTDASLRVALLLRGVDGAEGQAIAEVAAPFDVQLVALQDALEGSRRAPSTLDRLRLTYCLPDLDRLVYLDCDTLVLSDIAELASYRTGRTGLAARRLAGPMQGNLAALVERRARGLDTATAFALRDWSAERCDLAAGCFDAGVLVLSLEKLRDNGLAARALDLVRDFGLDAGEALNLATGGRANEIPAPWNTIPRTDLCLDAKLLHWAGRFKPWNDGRVLRGDDWRRAAQVG